MEFFNKAPVNRSETLEHWNNDYMPTRDVNQTIWDVPNYVMTSITLGIYRAITIAKTVILFITQFGTSQKVWFASLM